MLKKISLPFVLFLFLTSYADAYWSSVPKLAKWLQTTYVSKPASYSISNLSKLPVKELGQKLGKLKLSDEVLEDTYLRIAVHKGVIKKAYSIKMYSKLSGVPGFRTTLRKVIGDNPAGTKGHLNELRIATNAKNAGFKVLGIGEKFKDPLKKGVTDIDVVLKKRRKTFIIEAKDYGANTKIDQIKYRGDLKTLTNYQKQNKHQNIVPIFTFTRTPADKNHLNFLKREAKKHKVELLFGNPYEQMVQIDMLDKIR